MIIAITGSVGVGKTSFAKEFSRKLKFKIINLNEESKKFYLKRNEELETYEVDIYLLIPKIEEKLSTFKEREKRCIVEGHFAQFLSSKIVDKIIVLNRPLKELKEEYVKRKYNEQKISDNLEAESFDICFLEAQEKGYYENQIIRIENNKEKNFSDLINEVFKKLNLN